MKIYCSGIGGIGLSAYAAYQAASGHEVLGSDKSDSALLRDLRTQGITVFLNQDGSCVPSDCDLFVYSEAVPVDAPERVRARDFGIASVSYFHAVGDLTSNQFVVSVCGTHGKSSTTAMCAKLLMDADKDPGVIVGTKMPELNGRNWRKGASDMMVLESCEYRRSFHFISPDVILMTTVDGDHFDAYATIEEYREAFVTFLMRLPQDGVVITHGGDPDCLAVAQASGKMIINADELPLPEVGVPGLHMRENARLVMALAQHMKIPADVAQESLKGFHGTWRRMEVKGVVRGMTVIDDYAHHPKEIRATLQAMREAYPGKRIVCVFQPHTHDRTLKLYNDFLGSFSSADILMVSDVYNARRDIETESVKIDTFVSDIARVGKTETLYGGDLQNTLHLTLSTARDGDVVVFMGAGSIATMADDFLSF